MNMRLLWSMAGAMVYLSSNMYSTPLMIDRAPVAQQMDGVSCGLHAISSVFQELFKTHYPQHSSIDQVYAFLQGADRRLLSTSDLEFVLKECFNAGSDIRALLCGHEAIIPSEGYSRVMVLESTMIDPRVTMPYDAQVNNFLLLLQSSDEHARYGIILNTGLKHWIGVTVQLLPEIRLYRVFDSIDGSGRLTEAHKDLIQQLDAAISNARPQSSKKRKRMMEESTPPAKRPRPITNQGNSCYIATFLQLFAETPLCSLLSNYPGSLSARLVSQSLRGLSTGDQLPIGMMQKAIAAYQHDDAVGRQQDLVDMMQWATQSVVGTEDFNRDYAACMSYAYQMHDGTPAVCQACLKESGMLEVKHAPAPEFLFPVQLAVQEDGPEMSIEDLYRHDYGKRVCGEIRCSQDRHVMHNLEIQSNLTTFPTMLTFQLKRFRQNGTKITRPVKIMLTGLRLDTSPDYDLCGIGFHAGVDLHSGHYYAAVLKDGVWYLCNDGIIEPIQHTHLERMVHTGESYIVMYRKRALEILPPADEPSVPANSRPHVSPIMLHHMIAKFLIAHHDQFEAVTGQDSFNAIYIFFIENNSITKELYESLYKLALSIREGEPFKDHLASLASAVARHRSRFWIVRTAHEWLSAPTKDELKILAGLFRPEDAI